MRSMTAALVTDYWRVDGCGTSSTQSIEARHNGRVVFEATRPQNMKRIKESDTKIVNSLQHIRSTVH